jgi:excisionase family DNA binding protein
MRGARVSSLAMPDDKWGALCVGLCAQLRSTKKAMTVPELAAMLAVSERHVYALVQKGEIPSFKIGSAVRFDPEALWTWLQKLMGERRFSVLAKEIFTDSFVA